jgi:hypothetical protein
LRSCTNGRVHGLILPAGLARSPAIPKSMPKLEFRSF